MPSEAEETDKSPRLKSRLAPRAEGEPGPELNERIIKHNEVPSPSYSPTQPVSTKTHPSTSTLADRYTLLYSTQQYEHVHDNDMNMNMKHDMYMHMYNMCMYMCMYMLHVYMLHVHVVHVHVR